MRLSIITPWYEGAKYLTTYETMILDNLSALHPGQSMEVILVNDSPWEEIRPDALAPYLKPAADPASVTSAADPATATSATASSATAASPSLTVHILTHPHNAGIQASRVHGLAEASGQYVLFLDQDDALAPTAVRDFLCAAQEENDTLQAALVSAVAETDEVLAARMYVANASLEQSDGSYELWYRTPYHKSRIGDLSTYLSVGTQIISPGQVMLPKALIPEAYTDHIIQKNGADDYYLWLLLLSEGTEVCYIDKPLYTHHYTGENISADTRQTDASCYEFLTIMEEQGLMRASQIRRIRRMLTYKDTFRHAGAAGQILSSLGNLDILLPNLIYKLRTRTPYGYNR